jgi:hypothetical protein
LVGQTAAEERDEVDAAADSLLPLAGRSLSLSSEIVCVCRCGSSRTGSGGGLELSAEDPTGWPMVCSMVEKALAKKGMREEGRARKGKLKIRENIGIPGRKGGGRVAC